jgi:hypothetical protein
MDLTCAATASQGAIRLSQQLRASNHETRNVPLHWN